MSVELHAINVCGGLGRYVADTYVVSDAFGIAPGGVAVAASSLERIGEHVSSSEMKAAGLGADVPRAWIGHDVGGAGEAVDECGRALIRWLEEVIGAGAWQ